MHNCDDPPPFKAWKGRYSKEDESFTLARGGDGKKRNGGGGSGGGGGGSGSSSTNRNVIVTDEEHVVAILEQGGAGTGSEVDIGGGGGGGASSSSSSSSSDCGKLARKRKISADAGDESAAKGSGAPSPISVVVCQDDYHFWRGTHVHSIMHGVERPLNET